MPTAATVALVLFAGATHAMAQDAGAPPAAAEPAAGSEKLPTVTVETTENPAKANPVAKKKNTPSKAKSTATATKKPAPVAASEPVEVIEPATGTADPNASGDSDGGLSSGGVDGYRATRTSSGTKTDTPLRDVPQAISVVTAEHAKDIHAVDVNKALQYVPGVTVAQGESNRDQIVIRGQSTTADYFVDGVRDDVQYFRDLYNADRLEVLKGSNAMIFGRGGGGGVVNRVTKKAGEDVREGTVWAGSFDHKRATADVGLRVNNDFAVRLNGIYEDTGSFRDGVDLERYGINPTVFFRPSEDTRVWLSYEYFHDDRTADRGLPSLTNGTIPRRPYPGDISAFFGDPRLSVSDFDGQNVTATIEHKFSNDLKIRNHTYYGDFDKFYQNVFAATPVSGGTYSAEAYNSTLERQTFVNQTDVTYKFDGGWYGHTIVAGTEFSVQDSHSFRYDGQFEAAANVGASSAGLVRGRRNGISALNPTINQPITFTSLLNNTESTVTTSSGYIQDQFDITKYFQVIGGIRFDRFDIDATNLRTNADFGRVDDVWSPRIGVVVKPVEGISLYASYSKSFLPYSGDQFTSLDATTEDLQPEEFKNREIGFKWDIAPRLMLTGALFQLDRENTRVPDPILAGVVLQTGSTRTEGGEIELVGNVTDEWQIAAGYSRAFGEVTGAQGTTTGNTVPVGRKLANVPEDMFTLWNRYQVTPLFGVGVGIVHRSEIFASTSNTTVLPSYTRVDGALYFNVSENLDLQLNVENVFDEKYYASSHTDNNISPGAPRAFYVGVTSRF